MGTLSLVKAIGNFEENGGWFGEMEFRMKALTTRMAWMEPFGPHLFTKLYSNKVEANGLSNKQTCHHI